ncbi:MAG: hypothetical protein LRY52_08640, partial [Sulfurospirillum cavolei]|nr:hypothetical protein [Sulfurospirillum cavolei]
FQDYHILSEAPNVYLSDIHFRKMEGIYSYCTDSNDEVFTKVKPRLDCWTPKKADNAKEKATEYFEAGNNYDIADMLMARARVYSQQKNCSLAILHAIMSLEIVVPRRIDEYLRNNKISNKVIDTFDNKMDLSMRVKIFLKIIYPSDIHEIIDKVGEAIILRNKIIHCGLKESLMNSKEVSDLVNYCYILKKLLAIHLK